MLRGSELQAATFIKQYLSETGKHCFTYRGLRGWWSRHQKWRGSEWHTVERSIRALARMGYLRRLQYGRRVVFCPTPSLREIFRELDEIVVRG